MLGTFILSVPSWLTGLPGASTGSAQRLMAGLVVYLGYFSFILGLSPRLTILLNSIHPARIDKRLEGNEGYHSSEDSRTPTIIPEQHWHSDKPTNQTNEQQTKNGQNRFHIVDAWLCHRHSLNWRRCRTRCQFQPQPFSLPRSEVSPSYPAGARSTARCSSRHNAKETANPCGRT